MNTNTDTSLRDQAEALLARLESSAPDCEPFDINHFVHRVLARSHRVAAIWSVEDVQGIRPELTIDQAWEILEQVGDKHDAEWGINWTTLETVADDLFPESHDANQTASA